MEIVDLIELSHSFYISASTLGKSVPPASQAGLSPDGAQTPGWQPQGCTGIHGTQMLRAFLALCFETSKAEWILCLFLSDAILLPFFISSA